MLSFMREQGLESLEQAKESAVKQPDAAERSGPTDAKQDYLKVSNHHNQVRKSTYLLGALFCIGLICLWIMIKKSTPQTASAAAAEDKQIETAIMQLTGAKNELFDTMEEMVNKLYEFANIPQVASDKLIKNPFRAEKFFADLRGAIRSVQNDLDINAEIARQRQVAGQSGPMTLLSIMSTVSGRCCMIDYKIFYVGDTIRDYKVCEIGESFVRLELKASGEDANSGTEDTNTQLILKLTE